MATSARLGLAALAVGFENTAARLGQHGGSPLVVAKGDPGSDPEPLLRAFESLTREPFHPDAVRGLADDGFFESCPLTGGYVAEAVLRLALWPSDERELSDELAFFRRFCNLLYPTKGPMHGLEDDIVYRAQLVAWQTLLASAAPLAERAPEAFRHAVLAKMQSVARREEGNDLGERQAQQWLREAAAGLPDWESHVFLIGQGRTPDDEASEVNLTGGFKLAWRLRTSGLHDAAVPVLRVLHNVSDWPEIWWLLVEGLLDLGGTSLAGEILGRFPAVDESDPEALDARTTAAIRVAMAAGNQGAAASLAEPLIERYDADADATIAAYPRAIVCALDYRMQKEQRIRDVDLLAAFKSLDLYQEWPYANRLLISASAAFNLSQKKTDEAFAMFEDAVDRLPAELSFWHTMANQVSRTSDKLPRVVEHLVSHIERHPYLVTHWDLLARLTPEEALRQSISEDFAARGRALAELSAERPTLRRRIAAAGLDLGLGGAANRLDSNAEARELELPLPLGTMNYLRSIDLDVPAPRFVVAELQPAPLHRTTLVRLGQMGFFDAFPLLGGLAAGEALRERSWGRDVPSALQDADQRLRSHGSAGLDPMDALIAGLGAVPLGTSVSTAVWRRALAAKRDFVANPDEATLNELQWAMHTIGDPEATLILADAGMLSPPFGALLESLYILRLAGFLDAAATIATALFDRTNGRNVLLLGVDAELARGRVDAAAALVERFAEAGGDTSLEEPRAAQARVWLARGDAESVLSQLASFRADVEADPDGAGRVAPHSVAALADADLHADAAPLSQSLASALAVAAAEISRHPYIRAVQAAAGARSAMSIEADELVFADFIPVANLMPGEVELYEGMRPVLASRPDLEGLLEVHCRAQLARFPYLKRLWLALAATTLDDDLRQAIKRDLP